MVGQHVPSVGLYQLVTENRGQWRSLTRMTRGLKTYIPKNFYTKTTYITLLSEKFWGSGAPSRPFYTSPVIEEEVSTMIV
ncbi:hypothetical protein Hanom_Chr17g01540111 [Helianthus anomalus]